MRKTGWMGTVQIVAVLAMGVARAQEELPDTSRQAGRGWASAAGDGMANAVAAVATNEAVAKAIGLTKEQKGSLIARLQADKLRAALAASRLAEAVGALLTDADVVRDLGLTEAQVNAVRQAMTPALIRQAFAPQEIERLARPLTGGAFVGGMAHAFRDRMKQFDKDGDGNLSEEERQAAMGAWRARAGQGGPLRERMRQFDKDGDGRLSDEERKEAMDAWQRRPDGTDGAR